MVSPAHSRIINHLGMKHNAKLLAVADLGDGGIALYQANGRIFIIQHGDGFVEVMVPVSPSLSIDTTLAKLDEYIAGTI
jgi:hypothetical protein